MLERNMQDVHDYLASLSPLEALDPFLAHVNILGKPQVEEDGVSLSVRVEPHHLNGGASAHGGFLMTLLDATLACSTLGWGKGRSCVTVEMKTSFLSPGGDPGTVLHARGRVRAATHSLAFCEGEVRRDNGELVATASGTFKYVNRPMTVL